MEFRADADGPRGARHPQRHRHCTCDGRVGGAGCRRRATGWYERVQLARQLRLSAAQAVDRRRADATSDRGHDRRIRSPPAMTRLDATRVVVERARDAAIVASLGHPAYDLFTAGDRPRNFYTWGSMGLASSIGLGLALARPDVRVFVLDGDGSLLMNLGSLATIGLLRPSNLIVIVMDNEEYATTGGQATPTAKGADLDAAARAMRVDAETVRTVPELRGAVARRALQGPLVVV